MWHFVDRHVVTVVKIFRRDPLILGVDVGETIRQLMTTIQGTPFLLDVLE